MAGERRYKQFHVSPQSFLLWLTAADDAQAVTLPVMTDLPRDGRLSVVGLYPDAMAHCLRVTVEHPDFDPVPEGTYPPDVGPMRFDVVRFLRADPVADDCVAVTPPGDAV